LDKVSALRPCLFLKLISTVISKLSVAKLLINQSCISVVDMVVGVKIQILMEIRIMFKSCWSPHNNDVRRVRML